METISLDKFKTENEYKQYTISKEDSQKVDFVMKRFRDMEQARSNIDRNWGIYQDMIDAVFTPYPDERSSSVVPLASSIIELFVADAIKIPTEYRFRGETSKHTTNAKALEYVWKYDYRKENRKKVFNENEYITAGFGTSVIYTGYDEYEKLQKDFTVGDDLSISWEDKKIKKSGIVVKNIDIRNFYIDNTTIDSIDDASDCIYVQWISYEKFQNYKNNPLYKNIDKVKPQQYSLENNTFTTQEEEVKQGDFVKQIMYWNVERDMYVVIANDILVREHPMITTIDGEKALPFVIRNLGKKNYSIYGRGLCEALLMFNSEVNNLREMLMDAIRRSNAQTLALGNGLKFNGRQFEYDNEILTFDGNFAQNFQQISGNPPNQAIFNYLTQLYKDIAIYTGIDIQNIIGQAQQTAFQTEVQREASQKRINVWLQNRDLAFERFANLYKDLLQIYFPRKTAEGVYPTIEIEGEELIGEGEKQRFRKKKGHSMFEVTPEILRGDMYVDVYTNINAPTISAVERQLKIDFMNSIGTMVQGYAVAKQAGMDVEKVLPMDQNIRELASEFNLTPQEKDDNEDVKAAKNELRASLQGMLERQQGVNQPMGEPQQAAQPQQQPQETLVANQPQGQTM